MTPSVIQSSGCCLRLRSTRPIPSFPCSSSMSRSCELLLFTMTGPILRRIPSLNIGCTLEVSLVRRITDLSWRADDIMMRGVVPFTRKSMLRYKHKQDVPGTGCLTQVAKNAQAVSPEHTFVKKLQRFGQTLMYPIKFGCRSEAKPSIPFKVILYHQVCFNYSVT